MAYLCVGTCPYASFMTVDLVDHRRGSADKYSWMPPFDWSMAYENDRRWDEVRYDVDDPWFVQVVGDSVEVARVELDDPGNINPDYTGVPTIGPERLEIQFIEVAPRLADARSVRAWCRCSPSATGTAGCSRTARMTTASGRGWAGKVRPSGRRLARAFRPAGPASAGVPVVITVASRHRGFGAPRRGW